MRKYFRTLILFWSTSLSAQLEYKLNFIVEIIAMLGTLIGSVFLLSIFFSSGRQLGEWTWESALVVQGIYTFLDGITNSILRPNLREIVNYVREGTLDFVLLKPIDSQFWLSTRTISIAGLPEILIGLSLITWASSQVQSQISFNQVISFLLLLSFSVLILYSIWFIIASTSIWFVKTWNATEVLRAVLAAGRFPTSAYPILMRFLFTFILPIAFLTTVPAEVLLGRSDFVEISLAFLFSIIFFSISRIFWKFALRFYTSASS